MRRNRPFPAGAVRTWLAQSALQEGVKPTVREVAQAFGMVPNVMRENLKNHALFDMTTRCNNQGKRIEEEDTLPSPDRLLAVQQLVRAAHPARYGHHDT